MPKNDDVISFLEIFRDEKSCRSYLEEQLWPDGKPVCPHCKHDEKIYRYSNGKLFKCSKCKRQFQVTTNTIYQNSNIPLRKWFLGYYLFMIGKKGISSIQLSKELGITQKSAWYLMQKMRYSAEYSAKTKPRKKLSKIVEVDETYVGGKKKGIQYRGRSTKHKTPVFGMLQRGGELILTPVPDTKRATLVPIILQNVEKGSTIMSDEWWAYTYLNRYYKHKTVLHKAREYVRGNVHTNGIEGSWGHLKRKITGVHHHVSRKHLAKYCAEFQFKYNTRKDSTYVRFQAAVLDGCIPVKNSDITK